MAFLEKIFRRDKNPVKDMTHDELKETETKLKLSSQRLTKEISEIEKDIQQLFEKSKAAESKQEEINLANRIKTLGQQKEAKSSSHAEMEKQLRAVGNLLVIKEQEADLKAAGAWETLEKMPTEQLEQYLIDMKLQAEDRRTAVSKITELTSSTLSSTTEYDEGLEDILGAMHEVKEGKLGPEEAGKRVIEQEKEQGG